MRGRAMSPFDGVWSHEVAEAAKSCLTHREQTVVLLRSEEYTWREIAQSLGCNRERARQIFNRARFKVLVQLREYDLVRQLRRRQWGFGPSTFKFDERGFLIN